MISILKRILLKVYLKRIQLRFKSHTMIPSETYISNLELAFAYRKIEGIIVECGVWRGGMIAGIANILGNNKKYYLFDSFEGLPPAKEIDGEAAIAWQSDKNSPGYHNNCSASIDFANEAMKKSGAKDFKLVKGWFEKTLPDFNEPCPIAILRLDGDWYESTMCCLSNLVPKLAPRGIIIVDDYRTWDGCSRAVHDYLSRNDLLFRITERYGVAVIQQGRG